MRQIKWFPIGLALAAALSPATSGRAAEAVAPLVAAGPNYRALGTLPVVHSGRVKPFDTMAREELQLIHNKPNIVFKDAAGKKVLASWSPVAALFDWSVRPEYWDDQPIILVEYLPLKQFLFADSVKRHLLVIADKSTTPRDLGAELRKLTEAPVVTGRDVLGAARREDLPMKDREALKEWADKLGEEKKWLTPRELQDALVTVEGKKVSFDAWFHDLRQEARKREMSPIPTTDKLPQLDKKGLEVGTRLSHYQAIRGDRELALSKPIDLYIPRPTNEAYLKFTTESFKTMSKAYRQREDGLKVDVEPTAMEKDAVNILLAYWNEQQKKDRREPGTDAEFDRDFTKFLVQGADWVPLRVLLESDPKELEKAGYAYREIAVFRAAYDDARKAEAAEPGKLPEAKAVALVAAARDLGSTANVAYPPVAAMNREVDFNSFAPFAKAPWLYGTALALLLVAMGLQSETRSTLGRVRNGIYVAGLAAFVGGIALEAYGFYCRVRITGWAPVTNMYETVIWVAAVTSVLGLVLELISRKVYPAVAASGVAMITTILASSMPTLLDPNIHNLNPVLRSNFWLSIHVLTIVSSYAAFALAMSLGIIGTFFYLTSTYRHKASYAKLLSLAIPGLPLYAIGQYGVYASYETWSPPFLQTNLGYYSAAAVGVAGGWLLIMAVASALGEFVSRLLFRENPELGEAAIAGGSTSPASETASAGFGGGAGVATMARPSLAELRAKVTSARPKLDARGLAMQRTAARIKPISALLYRAMQVGVLLVAAGTILGGVWADYSWGRFWGWDPKEVWALITLLVYLIPLHGRFAGWINTFSLVCASVVCFSSVMIAWYGVNFLLGVGLHNYGFVEGGKQGVVTLVSFSILAVVSATAWRRSIASTPPTTSSLA